MSIKLEKGEDILFVARKHWFNLVAPIIGALILAIVPFVIYAINKAPGLISRINTNGNILFLGSAAVCAWFLILWIAIFVIWTDYALDVLVLTNKKVIDIEQRGLFSREISSFYLNRIQDITIDVNGIIPTLLDFGDIHIQTAGGDNLRFVLRGASKPHMIKEKILIQQYIANDDNSDKK